MKVFIKNSEERIRMALKIKKILELAGYSSSIFSSDRKHCDIGLKSDPVDQDTLAKVISQIERKGYTIDKKGPA
jgi:hypothetical protein